VSGTARARRRATHDHGVRAEWMAAALLTLKGYRVLARNYRGGAGEIDLVARRGDTIVFVEVKARGCMADAETAITPRKARRLASAARHWLARNPWATACTLRCDAVFIAPRAIPRHLAGAVTLALD